MSRNLIVAIVAGALVLAGGITIYKMDKGGEPGRTSKEVSAKTAS